MRSSPARHSFALGMVSIALGLAGCGDATEPDPIASTDMARSFDLSGPRSGTGNACRAGRSDRGTCTGDYQTCVLDGHNGFVGGYCTQDCKALACGDDSTCVRLAAGFERCLVHCNSDDDCRAPDYVCSPYKACIPALGVYLGNEVRPGTADGEACVTPPEARPTSAFATSRQVSVVSGAQPSLATNAAQGTIVTSWINLYGPTYLAVSSSSDDGASFSHPATLPPNIRVDTSVTQSDPVVAVDSKGTYYVAWLGQEANDALYAVYVARSMDGGVTFGDVFIVAKSDDTLTDAQFARPWIAVGPDDSVYVSWAGAMREDQAPAVLVARSVDGAQTFTAPVVATPAMSTQHARPQIAVSSDGSVYVASVELLGDTFGDVRNKVSLQRLTADLALDGGRVQLSGEGESPTLDWPSLVVDGDHVYVAYTAGSVYGAWDIRVAASADRGATFHPSVIANSDPSCATHFHPALAVDSSRRVHVVFYDNRYGDGNLFHAVSIGDAGSGSLAFGDNELVNDAPFPFTTESAGPDWLGAHPAIAIANGTIYVAWTDPRTNGTAQIFFSQAEVSP